ncbi:MAG: ABC transporter permease subunit [Eubacteriales bacterium]|nr:ABC transporter permease subunit [Eubacteriales bacterium]
MIVLLTKPKDSIWKRILSNWQFYVLMLPGILFFICIKVFPVWGLSIAFVNFKMKLGVLGSKFVGFDWFIKFFSGSNFPRIMRNTLVISLMDLLLAFPVPIILSLALNEIRSRRYQRTVQSVIYMPHFMSWVVISGFTFLLFSVDVGLVNKAIRMFGGQPVNFLTNQQTFWWVLLFQNIWKESGWGTIIYLACISQIDQGLYEAAVMDGANRMQRMWHVTLPGISSTLIVMFIMKLGRMLNISFEQVFMMTNDMVSTVADTLDLYAYRIGIQQGNYSIGTAVGLFKSVIGCLLVIGSNWIIKKTGNEGMF